ncbi:MAG: hypothetical protein KZQ74_08935 [gamma proteobacterium symbiont of Bathyaustriella thionipta]|nr:hypothetical protein [gamma proteobacterium symbiont of Bathyaustriella thionipta]MCU7958292.1 hypothetical protein [gamma proteobacterium symbiont of Bathyaustriella thionipta]MCU7967300.1 hypothetical protein [gamma proteobacterium symbiont of Bathyaustriella thionipta]
MVEITLLQVRLIITMTLLNSILKWTETLPDWQRDASRRLLQQEDGLTEDDYA